MAATAYLLARADRTQHAPWAWSALTGALAFLLAVSWIPPSTIADVRRNSQIVGGPYPLEATNIWYGLLAAVVLVGIDRLLVRFHAGTALRFGAYYAMLAGAPVAVREIFGPAIVPQPERYHLEMEQGFCILLAFAGAALVTRLPKPAGTQSDWRYC